jgi:hypothetical protein
MIEELFENVVTEQVVPVAGVRGVPVHLISSYTLYQHGIIHAYSSY